LYGVRLAKSDNFLFVCFTTERYGSARNPENCFNRYTIIKMICRWENRLFIATDASDEQAVKSIMNNTGFTINYAPILAQIPESQRGQGYLFLNGIKGEAPNGFQLPVANAVPR
jgi:hypothetical protein